MRRTLDRHRFPVSDVSRGEVVVATTFTHPARGLVTCPAALLAGAGMLPSGLPVRRGSVTGGAGDAVLHAASYVDPNGRVVGLGVATHRDDVPAMRLAEDVVGTWADVMRTRRVMLAATGPSCAGLRLEAAMLAPVSGPTYRLAGPRAKRPRDLPALGDAGLVERLADVPHGATVALPACGVDQRTAEARAVTAERGVWVLEGTCPLVARAHATARRFAEEGATVVVLGGAGNAAAPALAGQVPGSIVVTSLDEIDDLVIDPATQVAFVISPGLPVEDAHVLAARLRSRIAGTIGQHPDELCYAASDRRSAIRAVACSNELTLVLGDPDADDTRTLAATTATETGNRVEQLADLAQLRPAWLAAASSIGVVVGGSARPHLAGELIRVLSGLGPISVARRRVTTEIMPAEPAAASVFDDARRAG